ncbi:outer membrane lipoprotein-sorting protein [Prosthecobacter sp.]|uniref:outer membrane lipoprotein-sorting protein n=1 Tax=Prosthecobacter sp. TaxID=1965333 RepID=UPI003784B152
MKTFLPHLICAFLVLSASAAENGPSAGELAARLSALQQDGTSFIRLKMEGPQTTLQVQIKQRRTQSGTEVMYQILWPKERAGEAVLLRKMGSQPPAGALLTPPDTVIKLDASRMKERLLGTDLAYADVLENFFAWEHQAIVGTEIVDRTSCQVLESKPGKSDRSIYAVVRTWVDTRRLVPLRVEKYSSSGQLARRIDTTRVVSNDGRSIPANMTVHDAQRNSATELDGSNIKRGVSYDDATFTVEGLKQTEPPRSRAD